MKIAVLFDGAGLARLGLEQAGHDCIGFELDPWKHHLSKFVGSGNCVLADATTVELSKFDAVWASPPCQSRSDARTQGPPISKYAGDYLDWCLSLPHRTLWVENIMKQGRIGNDWGRVWNAAQFTIEPIQNRNRIIGGRYQPPRVFRPWKKAFVGVCPCVTATEYKGCASDTRRASRFYGRRITIDEAAHHQGFKVPDQWKIIPDPWFADLSRFPSTRGEWQQNLYEAIGNGVPVYMARAFGEAILA